MACRSGAPSSPGGTAPVEACAAAPEPQPRQVGQLQRPGAQAVAVAAPRRAGRGDVAERVGAGVAEGAGVLGTADSDGIHHQQESAFHDPAGVSAKKPGFNGG